MTRANDEWRNDPARRQAAADLHARWMAALDAAEPLLMAVGEVFRGLPIPQDVASAQVVRRVGNHVGEALDELEMFSRGPASETLIGNMAAFGIGYDEADHGR